MSFGGNIFQFTTCTICVNTHISKALMATAFESLKGIANTIVQAAKIINHAFSYFIETVEIFFNLGRYTTENYFFHSPSL